MSSRILQLCLSPDLGGLELYMLRLTKFLQAHSSVHICVNKEGKLRNALSEVQDLSCLPLLKPSWKNIFNNAKSLARYIDTHAIDCLHMHWTKDLPLCVLAIKLSQRKPRLIQSRHMNMTRFKSDFYHRYLYKNIDMMIAVTQQVKEQIIRYVPEDICPKVEVSYIGSPAYTSLSDENRSRLLQQYDLKNSFVIALAGRIEPAKGQALLIDAIHQLNNPTVKVLLIGDAMQSEYLEEFKAKISSLGLKQQVIFTGFVNNVQDLMAISDCVVLATDKETFGMVLVEAMHTETAVIASNCGGPLEIIENDKEGLLFKSRDATDLAQQIEKYLTCTELKKQHAIAGKQKAKSKFDNIMQFEEVLSLLTTERQEQ